VANAGTGAGEELNAASASGTGGRKFPTAAAAATTCATIARRGGPATRHRNSAAGRTSHASSCSRRGTGVAFTAGVVDTTAAQAAGAVVPTACADSVGGHSLSAGGPCLTVAATVGALAPLLPLPPLVER
jgi:hypothetical protein